MKKVQIFLLVLVMVMMTVSPVLAGRLTKTLSVFPHISVTEQIEIPTIEGVDESQCAVDLTGVFTPTIGECVSEPKEGCYWKQLKVSLNCPPDECEARKEWALHCDEPTCLEDAIEESCEIITETDMSKVKIDCPPGSVQTGVAYIPVTYDKLVVEAKVGDVIHASGTLFTKNERTVTYWMRVIKVYPNLVRKVIFRSPKIVAVVDGTATTEIEFTFDKPGIYRFEFRVLKPDGRVGKVWSKVLVR